MKTRKILHAGVWLSFSLMSVFAGCAAWEPRKVDDTTRHENSAWTNDKRQKAPPGSQLGIDSRAREIERSLGVE